VELTILGAGPAYTDRPGALGSAYLVRAQGAAIVLDLGQGVFPSLAREVEPSSLDGIAISHLHPDHFIDLVALRHYLRFEFQPPRRVTVLGPRDLAARLDALHAETGFTEAVLDTVPLEPGVRQIGRFEVEARRVTHTDDSFGFRVSVADGRAPGLVYSGDCGVASDLAPLVREGDTLLTECSFGIGPVSPGAAHLDAPAIGDLAASTGPGRILLTHIQMGFDREAAMKTVRERYQGPVELVDPGRHFTID
jgi:ribonuclease BN (tRNA processing enzyme)